MNLRERYINYTYPVGGLEHVFFSPYIRHVILPTDEVIFFRGVGQPPTRLLLTIINHIITIIINSILTVYYPLVGRSTSNQLSQQVIQCQTARNEVQIKHLVKFSNIFCEVFVERGDEEPH